MVDVLKERGWFWWGDLKRTRIGMLPTDRVGGTLTIDDSGRIEIELDEILNEPLDRTVKPMAASNAPDQSIAGILKSDQYIFAFDVHRTNRHIGGNISFETFSAQICLLSSQMLPRKPRARAVQVDLTDYEEWLRRARPSHKITRRRVALKYTVPSDARYVGQGGHVSIQHSLWAELTGAFGLRGAEVRPSALFRFTPRLSMDLMNAIETFISIQDFFIILTGSAYLFSWPSLRLTTGQTCIAYFQKNKGNPSLPSAHQYVTYFYHIQADFGRIFFTWLLKRNEIGPGFYLYLSTRRWERLYEEHRFTSLVSGLETFHRSLFGDPMSARVAERMTRILGDIQDEKDREWLRKRTLHLGTPNLERRLREILAPVPLNIDRSKLNVFCTLAAKIRNELFHTGKSATAIASGNALQFLNEINSALSYLYHARIMIEIGLPSIVIEHWLKNSSDSYRIRRAMERVGLHSLQA